jgi:luciferase family oxidoreductase group 1
VIPISILDLAPIVEGGTAAQALHNAADLARHAERWGFARYWLAEHHNMPGIASAATSVAIAHVAAATSSIRVGAGGIMLPNHAPLVIAEQFGTLDALHPGRIDLGLGRAPGTDPLTAHALRRTLGGSVDSFPDDVVELMDYFGPAPSEQRVRAIPGAGADIEIWILGSSLYGAELAGALGLPYAFASHFAPAALHAAIAAYRTEFRASEQLEAPYVIAGVNVVAADTASEAEALLQGIRRRRAVNLYGRQLGIKDLDMTDEQADQLLAAGAAAQVDEMLTYTAAGTQRQVHNYLDGFLQHTGADELMVTHQTPTIEGRLRSVALLGDAMLNVPTS